MGSDIAGSRENLELLPPVMCMRGLLESSIEECDATPCLCAVCGVERAVAVWSWLRNPSADDSSVVLPRSVATWCCMRCEAHCRGVWWHGAAEASSVIAPIEAPTTLISGAQFATMASTVAGTN
jgi:hypothetical protein